MRQQRQARRPGTPQPTTIWLTGLSGAGKTTVARCVRDALGAQLIPSCVVDGDDLREGLSDDLGFSRGDRAEQARRAAHVALLIAKARVVAIVALITPYEADRRLARSLHRDRGVAYVEVWVDTPLEICAERDVKGLYARARSGGIDTLTGVGAPYERPVKPDLHVAGCALDPRETASAIIDHALRGADAETHVRQPAG